MSKYKCKYKYKYKYKTQGVKREHSGNYTCRVANTEGEGVSNVVALAVQCELLMMMMMVMMVMMVMMMMMMMMMMWWLPLLYNVIFCFGCWMSALAK